MKTIKPEIKTKRFLILGHPRCRTGYMARLFQRIGFKVGHETMDEDGISSWLFAVISSKEVRWGSFKPEMRSRGLAFNHVVHVIRDPVTSIASIVTESRASEEFRKQHVMIYEKSNPIERAVQSYVGWNKLISAQQPNLVVKLENAYPLVCDYMVKNRVAFNTGVRLPPTDFNSRKNRGDYPSIGYGEIENSISSELLYEFNRQIGDYEMLDAK